MTEIRALSWKNPFAVLMLYGKVETRTWSTKYRGKVLICASKTAYDWKTAKSIMGVVQALRFLENHIAGAYNHNGMAIAVGDLVDCRPMKFDDEDQCYVMHREGLFCHVYENVRPIEPFYWKGSQGWKKLSENDILKIKYI